MSKFDVTKARKEADWYLEYPEEDKRLSRFAMMMRAACNTIDALEARLAKLERVREAAEKTKCVTPEVGPRGNFPCFVCPVCELHSALVACDDGEGT